MFNFRRKFVHDLTRANMRNLIKPANETLVPSRSFEMHKFTVITKRTIEAETAEEAAMLMYQELNNASGPLSFSVTDENATTIDLTLDRKAAESFSSEDHTADPGNW